MKLIRKFFIVYGIVVAAGIGLILLDYIGNLIFQWYPPAIFFYAAAVLAGCITAINHYIKI